MNKKKYSTLLIWSAALISVVRYAGAFIASDIGSIVGKASEILTIFMGITGVGMGLLDSIGTAFLFNGWRLAMPRTGDKAKPRFKILTFFVISLFLSGLFILTPYTVSRVAHLSVWEVLGKQGTWVWAFFVNVAPILIIGGVTSGNANIVEEDHSGNLPENSRKVSVEKSESFRSDWRKVRSFISPEELQAIAYDWTTSQISSHYKLPADGRSARHWKRYAQQELEAASQN